MKMTHPSAHRTLCIHQPDFAPWLGFFQRLVHCDALIILDHVQFVRRGWHNRDKFIIGGKEKWLTVPVISKGKFDQSIMSTMIDNTSDWQTKHLASIRSSYCKAPYFSPYFEELTNIYSREYLRMIDLNMALIKWGLAIMELNPSLAFSSALSPTGNSNDMLVDLCETMEASTYYSGQGAKAYLDTTKFERRGIKVVWQHWEMPGYVRNDCHTGNGLSFIDALFHIGPEVKNLIR